MPRVLDRFLASLARLAVRSGRSKDLEIIVLRHQLSVLMRQVDRPVFTDDDRSLLDATAQAFTRAHECNLAGNRRHASALAPRARCQPMDPAQAATWAAIKRH